MSSIGDIRRERFRELAELPPGIGLEIGPLAQPIILADRQEVRYVDVVDRDGLRYHYRDDPSVECNNIPGIDYTLTTEDGVVTLAEAVRAEAPYAYVVASHVIEHVPDIIGWLGDIAEVLVDRGLVLLVIPDKRHCFDYYRHQTSVGQMLQAADAHDVRPSVRAVYDHFRDAVQVSAADTWSGVAPAQLSEARLHTLDGTLAQVERARSGHYVDCHVWTFTPETFAEQIEELALIDLCDFEIEALLPTPHDSLEFYVVLRRVPRGMANEAKRALIQRSLNRHRASVTAPPNVPQAHAEEMDRLEAQLDANASQLELRRELEAIRRSRQWRVGGAALDPIRRLRRVWTRVMPPADKPQL